jgi:hypothetical protein
MGPSGVSSQAAKRARAACRGCPHDLGECIAKAAARFIAGVELRHDHALAGADRLERGTETARSCVLHESHPEPFLKLTARRRGVDVERVEIGLAPALVGLALYGVEELAHDSGSFIGMRQRPAPFAGAVGRD